MLDGKAPASRMKLIVLGEVGAGKTSLTRSLSGQAFEEAREETRGIETSSVSEMMQNTELDGSWKLADPADSHVDQVIANLLSQYLDLNDLPDIYKFLRLGNCMMAPLASLPQSSGEHLSDEIVQSPAKEFDQYPGLSTPSGTQSRFLVTEEMVDVEGSPRKLPASLIARTLLQKDNTGVSVKVNIWDFAGHQLYETMHHVFLNSRSLYLVVFSLLKFTESEEKSLATIHYWLNSIAVHTSDSTPIFLVGTHKAKVDEKQVKYADRLLVKHFEDAFGSRLVRKSEDKCIFAVENSHCQDDEGVSCLITTIKKEASNLSFVSEELPVKWLHCEEEIFTRQQDPNCEKCLSIEEVRKLFEEKCHVQFTDEEFRLMLNFFHDSGLIILPGTCITCRLPLPCIGVQLEIPMVVSRHRRGDFDHFEWRRSM